MHSALRLRVAVGVLAFDQDRRLADAGLIARLNILQFHLKPATLRPALVHAEQDVGPVVRLGAAGA